MLKQILRDMYVDPEILAALDETYKQTLFCRMREEQIRRWRIWDEKQKTPESDHMTNKSASKSKNTRKVDFRLGPDGEPWVWVMGEHPDDLTIEDILEEEAKQKARELAETEFRKSVEVRFTDMLEYDRKKSIEDTDMVSPKIEDMEIYCSVDELRDRINPQPQPTLNNYVHMQNVLQEICYNKPNPTTQKVSARIAQWEQRAIGQRTSEIFKQIQKKKEEVAKQAEVVARQEEELWREQQRKAKQAELQMREIARRAREEHRKSLINEEQSPNVSPPLSLDPMIPRPANQEAVVQWYRNTEFAKKAGLTLTGQPEKWFHGLVTRTEAEALLANEKQGTFLVRISEKIWGYAISYKDSDRCKHYLVDASNMKYQFLGQNQLQHDTLGDLVRYHTTVPITILGYELLQRPCHSKFDVPPVLGGLLRGSD